MNPASSFTREIALIKDAIDNFKRYKKTTNKLQRIRSIANVHFNDSRFKRIVEIIDE